MLKTNLGKIGVGWAVVCVLGISSFYLSKKNIVKRRYDDMKVRQRMRESNTGEYSPSYRFSKTSSTSEV